MDTLDIIKKGEALRNGMVEKFGITLPEDMIAVALCKCKRETGLVWGLKNDKNQTRRLRDEYGIEITMCGACMIELEKKTDEEHISKRTDVFKEAEKLRKAQREAEKKADATRFGI